MRLPILALQTGCADPHSLASTPSVNIGVIMSLQRRGFLCSRLSPRMAESPRAFLVLASESLLPPICPGGAFRWEMQQSVGSCFGMAFQTLYSQLSLPPPLLAVSFMLCFAEMYNGQCNATKCVKARQ